MEAKLPQLPPDALAETGESAPTLMMKLTVYGSLALAVLLALALIIGTGVRWMTQPTPSSIVIFHSDASLVDSTISILDSEGTNERRVSIEKTADFATPIFLEPGTYTLTVRHAGNVIYHDYMYVAEGNRYDIDITPRPATRP